MTVSVLLLSFSMFTSSTIEVKALAIDDQVMATLLDLHKQIPEFDRPLTASHIHLRLQDKPYLLLLAFVDDKAVGYKFGYQLSDQVFYSSLGGVHPDYRRDGVAKQLLLMQEGWALTQGYKKIKVKSMNLYPAMLQMLIRNRYHICGYEERGDPSLSKIVFEKWLL